VGKKVVVLDLINQADKKTEKRCGTLEGAADWQWGKRGWELRNPAKKSCPGGGEFLQGGVPGDCTHHNGVGSALKKQNPLVSSQEKGKLKKTTKGVFTRGGASLLWGTRRQKGGGKKTRSVETGTGQEKKKNGLKKQTWGNYTKILQKPGGTRGDMRVPSFVKKKYALQGTKGVCLKEVAGKTKKEPKRGDTGSEKNRSEPRPVPYQEGK